MDANFRNNVILTQTERLTMQKQTKAIYQKYQRLDPKKRGAYAEKHAEEIRLYKDAADYFKAVMNGRTELPIKKWKKEFIDLTTEKYSLCDEYTGWIRKSRASWHYDAARKILCER